MSTINLLPEDYLTRRHQRRANTLCVALFAVVMAGVGAAAVVSETNTRHTKQVRDRVNASYAEAAKLLTQMQQLEASKRQMVKKAQATASLLERVPRSYLLATVAQALPSGTALVEVSLGPSKVSRQQAAEKTSKYAAAKKGQAEPSARARPPMSLEATGLAATDVEVAGFISNLNGNPLLTSVDLNYSQEKALSVSPDSNDKISLREFKVTMELRSNVDVIDLLKPQAADSEAVSAAAQRQGAGS